METDILNAVIQAEREIQQKLEGEQKKAREWLQSVRTETDQALLAEEARLKALLEEAVTDAKAQAERRAEELVASAVRTAKALGAMSEEALRGLVERALIRILP